MRKILTTIAILTTLSISAQVGLNTNFEIKTGSAIDTKRMSVVDMAERDSIEWKYEGLITYVQSIDSVYVYDGSNWFTLGSSSDIDTTLYVRYLDTLDMLQPYVKDVELIDNDTLNELPRYSTTPYLNPKNGDIWKSQNEIFEYLDGGYRPIGVQSDWDETSVFSLAYIKNKPDMDSILAFDSSYVHYRIDSLSATIDYTDYGIQTVWVGDENGNLIPEIVIVQDGISYYQDYLPKSRLLTDVTENGDGTATFNFSDYNPYNGWIDDTINIDLGTSMDTTLYVQYLDTMSMLEPYVKDSELIDNDTLNELPRYSTTPYTNPKNGDIWDSHSQKILYQYLDGGYRVIRQQSDWNESSLYDPSFIRNKPNVISSVNDQNNGIDITLDNDTIEVEYDLGELSLAVPHDSDRILFEDVSSSSSPRSLTFGDMKATVLANHNLFDSTHIYAALVDTASAIRNDFPDGFSGSWDDLDDIPSGFADGTDDGDNMGNHQMTTDISGNSNDIDNVAKIGIGANASTDELYVRGSVFLNDGTNNQLIGNLISSAGTYNNIFGQQAGRVHTGSYNTILGYKSGYSNDGTGNFIAGRSAGSYNTGNDNVLMNTNAGQNNTGNKNVIMNFQAGFNNTGNSNMIFGEKSGYNNTGDENFFSGYYAGSGNSGNQNFVVGKYAGYQMQGGSYNTIIGEQSGRYNTTHSNVYIGRYAGHGVLSTITSGGHNIGIGYQSLYKVNGESTYNIAMGYQSNYNDTNGSYNVNIGYRAGKNSQTNKSIHIGKDAGYSNYIDNMLYIDNSSSASPLILGDMGNDWLDINGTLKIQDVADATDDYLLSYNTNSDEVTKVLKSSISSSTNTNIETDNMNITDSFRKIDATGVFQVNAQNIANNATNDNYIYGGSVVTVQTPTMKLINPSGGTLFRMQDESNKQLSIRCDSLNESWGFNYPRNKPTADGSVMVYDIDGATRFEQVQYMTYYKYFSDENTNALNTYEDVLFSATTNTYYDNSVITFVDTLGEVSITEDGTYSTSFKFRVKGSSNAIRLSKWDGTSWTVIGHPQSYYVNDQGLYQEILQLNAGDKIKYEWGGGTTAARRLWDCSINIHKL